MKYNNTNYHNNNSIDSLKELYYQRIKIKNIYKHNPKLLLYKVNFVESEILKHEKGMVLLINLQIISENRRELENLHIKNPEERKFKFLKLLDCANNCEYILNLKKDSIITYEEKIYKNWITITSYMSNFIDEFKEQLLLCGCNEKIE